MQKLGAARLGFSPMDVGAHSLRSGISISVHIDDVLDQTLMVIGWWHWLVFVVYIQQQILLFSTGILVCMSSQPWFRHLWAGAVHRSHLTHIPNFCQDRIYAFARVTSSFEPPDHTSIRFNDHFTFPFPYQKFFWLSQRVAFSNFPTKFPARSPS